MKKFRLSFFSAIIAFVLVLAGCGPTSSDPSESESVGSGLPTLTEEDILDEPALQIHYKRGDNKYDSWCLWLWTTGKEGSIYHFNYADDNGGVIAYHPLSVLGGTINRVGFIVRDKQQWTKDVSIDRFMDLDALTPDENNTYHVWLKSGKEEVWVDPNYEFVMNSIEKAEFHSETRIALATNNEIRDVQFYCNEEELETTGYEGSSISRVYTLDESHAADPGQAYKVRVTFDHDGRTLEKTVSITALYNANFDAKYNYDGELGAIYTPEQTEFRVWSPVSKRITLKIYNSGTPKAADSVKGDDTVFYSADMTLGDKGVYSHTVSGDLEGKYYTYTVYNGNNLNGAEIVDPYAKSAGVHGVRGMIVDFSKTNPTGWDEVSLNPANNRQLTVWETHVADVTSSETWTGTENYRKKFLGLIEEGTTYTKDGKTVKTGFDHIKELGVNAVQLIPVFDQANNEVDVSFNWGYNPLNYNVIEGAYSTNPYDGYTRIREFKEVIKKFADNDMNIIMDVVYNHTNGLIGSNFDVLMPGYYYRYDIQGAASNGSGCGNETASEKYMFRKFMIDSATFLAEEYKLGGYRFDLMGVHDVETMNLLTAACKEINPNITIYGEPWAGGTIALTKGSPANQANARKYQGYGQFNDQMRDALIKGGLNSATAKGWVSDTNSVSSADVNKIKDGMVGTTSSATTDPNKTVNYVTCHDNYTLVDRFAAAGIRDADLQKKMAVLSNSVVFTSQGTTFMLAGEEFLRTKGGDHNSYTSSYKVNELDYALKIQNADVFDTYKALIALKQSVDGLHLNEEELEGNYSVESLFDGKLLKATIKDTTNGKEYVVYHRNGVVSEEAIEVETQGYSLYLNTLGKTLGTLNHELSPFETLIMSKAA